MEILWVDNAGPETKLRRWWGDEKSGDITQYNIYDTIISYLFSCVYVCIRIFVCMVWRTRYICPECG